MAGLYSGEKRAFGIGMRTPRGLQVLIGGAAWIALTLAGCSGEDPLAPSSGGSASTSTESSGGATSETKGGASFASPEAAFQAEKQAQIDNDWGAHFDVYTPESQKELVGTLAYTSGSFGGMTGKADEVKAILKKYGMDESMMPEKPSMTDMANMKAMVEKAKEAQAKLTAAIKDRRAFYIEMASLMNNAASGGAMNERVQAKMEEVKSAQAAAKLVDVEITGDSAVGRREIVNNGTTMKLPVYFEKIGGSWYMRQPTMEEARKMGEEIGRAIAEKMKKGGAPKANSKKE